MTRSTSPVTQTAQECSAVPARSSLTLLRRGKPFAQVAACRAHIGRNRSRVDPTSGRFTRADAADLVRGAFERFEHQIPDLPSEPTVGSRQNVALSALTLAFLEALEASGVPRDYAIELAGDICWRFYRHWGQAILIGTRLRSRNSTRRLRLGVNAFVTYPFGRPGYRFDDVPDLDGRSLDMLRCPVADYLGKRDAADLCAASWCNLDYALAEMWGARRERSGTLVGGATCCDFRFHTIAPSSVESGS